MIIDYLTLEERNLLKLVTFKKGEILFHEHDSCDELGIINKGEVIIASLTYEGNEIIYNSLEAGAIFGNNLIFSSDNRFRGDVKARKDGELYLIKKDNLIKVLMENKRFLLSYLSFNSDFTKELNSQIKLLSFNSAKERLLYYLFLNDNKIIIKSVTSLAGALYLSREATSRLLSELEKEKIIERNNNEITLIDSSFFF
ncbi:MAG: Crp/Fnr family transcriptional regulator [Bacilli bacterium]|nr:Crp/Fnr family transcriptional regulator [Bacilli bacterium]